MIIPQPLTLGIFLTKPNRRTTMAFPKISRLHLSQVVLLKYWGWLIELDILKKVMMPVSSSTHHQFDLNLITPKIWLFGIAILSHLAQHPPKFLLTESLNLKGPSLSRSLQIINVDRLYRTLTKRLGKQSSMKDYLH